MLCMIKKVITIMFEFVKNEIDFFIRSKTKFSRKNFVEKNTRILEFIEKEEKNIVFIMYDFHVNFGLNNRPPDYEIVRKLRDLVSSLKVSISNGNSGSKGVGGIAYFETAIDLTNYNKLIFDK